MLVFDGSPTPGRDFAEFKPHAVHRQDLEPVVWKCVSARTLRLAASFKGFNGKATKWGEVTRGTKSNTHGRNKHDR